jgi:hypothetical protein
MSVAVANYAQEEYCRERLYPAFGMRRSALSENLLHSSCQQISAAVSFPHLSPLASGLVSSPQLLRPPWPLSLQLVCRTRTLVSPRPRRNAYSKGLSLPSPYDSSPPFISLSPSSPRPARILAQHRPSPVPRAAGTAPALLRPLALYASGSAQSASPAFVGLAPSRANAIGGALSDLDSVGYSSCALRFLCFSFTASTFYLPPFMLHPCHRLV